MFDISKLTTITADIWTSMIDETLMTQCSITKKSLKEDITAIKLNQYFTNSKSEEKMSR